MFRAIYGMDKLLYTLPRKGHTTSGHRQGPPQLISNTFFDSQAGQRMKKRKKKKKTHTPQPVAPMTTNAKVENQQLNLYVAENETHHWQLALKARMT